MNNNVTGGAYIIIAGVSLFSVGPDNAFLAYLIIANIYIATAGNGS